MSDTTAPALWLWLDCESTGLLDSRPAVLEAAWMLSDDQLRQLTPLRQRLTALSCVPSWQDRLAAWARLRPAHPRVDSWPHLPMSPQVEEMHIESGLSRDWRNDQKIRDVQDLDMLIHEDHLAALERLDPGGTEDVPLHLAGAGVAQFEARLFPAIGSTVLDWCHYRAADSSVAAMTLGVPKNTEVADGLELDVQEGVDVERATTAPHRAATDVRAAYRQVWDLRSRLVTTEGSRA